MEGKERGDCSTRGKTAKRPRLTLLVREEGRNKEKRSQMEHQYGREEDKRGKAPCMKESRDY